MGLGRRALTTAGLGLVAACVVGCGSSQDLLTAHDHGQLTANLLAVTQAVDKGNCPDTSDALAELDSTIDGLPTTTNTTLHDNLVQGAKVLRADAARQCHRNSPKPPVTSSTTTSTSSTTTTESMTTTQAATSSTPAPTTPPQRTATAPPATQTSSATATSPGPPTTSTNGGAGLTPNGGGNG